MTTPERWPNWPQTVHVIVTCTNRKTLPVAPILRLGNVRGRGTVSRAREWTARLAGMSSSPLIAAQDLYAGEHWTIARSLPGRARHARVKLWVCSAGYGLIPADALVHPYAATFSSGSDRVPGGAYGARQWWDALTGWEGPAPREPRSIRSLVAADRSASFLLALSASYLDACLDDLAAAAGEVADLDTFMVISAGTRLPRSGGVVMVPADARLQELLGGTRQALNARLAAQLLSAGISSRAEAANWTMRLLAEQPPITRYERKKLSDQEVTEMITRSLAQSPQRSASRLLREFRDAGYACEQQRFAGLYRAVTGAKA
jgi:hypothetical protein